MSHAIRFTKMVGTGNDFLIVDAVHDRPRVSNAQWPVLARAMCDRRYGVGADGVLLLEPSHVADAKMRVLNPDGSEADMCGNGARCVARFIAGRDKPHVSLETAAGLIHSDVVDDRIRLALSPPTGFRAGLRVVVGGRTFRLSFINTGVPHAVAAVDDLETLDVERVGRAIRTHRLFAPQGTNVNFMAASAKTPTRIQVRTYERGVEGETLACGTGVTAAAIVHVLTRCASTRQLAGPHQQIDVMPKSGERLHVSFAIRHDGAAPRVEQVVLEGPVRRICEGVFHWSNGHQPGRGRS